MVARSISPITRNCNPEYFNQWKHVTINEFPGGVEVLFKTNHETCQDMAMFDENEKTERGEGDRVKSIDRAARRAKTQVRRQCKMMEADQMLTLTYRENMTDRDRLERDYKEFIRRLRMVIPGFQYVAGIEKQKRGALHLHVACQAVPATLKTAQGVKVKSYNLVRAIWRSVVGADNGNVDLTKPRRNRSHRIACYIAKYISKTVEDAVFNAKSYWSSRGTPKPKKTVFWFSKGESDFEIVGMLLQEFTMRGFTEIAQYADRMNEFYWFSASRPS